MSPTCMPKAVDEIIVYGVRSKVSILRDGQKWQAAVAAGRDRHMMISDGKLLRA